MVPGLGTEACRGRNGIAWFLAGVWITLGRPLVGAGRERLLHRKTSGRLWGPVPPGGVRAVFLAVRHRTVSCSGRRTKGRRPPLWRHVAQRAGTPGTEGATGCFIHSALSEGAWRRREGLYLRRGDEL